MKRLKPIWNVAAVLIMPDDDEIYAKIYIRTHQNLRSCVGNVAVYKLLFES